MNVALAQTPRLTVSPYARRLARERAIPLEACRGTGPAGRILAADVLAFVPLLKADAPAAAVSVAAAPRTAAFAASVSLDKLRMLLSALESTGNAFNIEDILLRAAAHAFEENPRADRLRAPPLALELTGRQVVFTTVPEMTMTALRAARLSALADERDDTDKPAALSLRILPAYQIRPLLMPLLPGRAMRLTVCATTRSNQAETLLTTDAANVDEVAAWLSALKCAIENPLTLFV